MGETKASNKARRRAWEHEDACQRMAALRAEWDRRASERDEWKARAEKAEAECKRLHAHLDRPPLTVAQCAACGHAWRRRCEMVEAERDAAREDLFQEAQEVGILRAKLEAAEAKLAAARTIAVGMRPWMEAHDPAQRQILLAKLERVLAADAQTPIPANAEPNQSGAYTDREAQEIAEHYNVDVAALAADAQGEADA